MNDPVDKKAIQELYAMARVYYEHGHIEKGDQMIALAKKMQLRLDRDNQIVDLNDFREDRRRDA